MFIFRFKTGQSSALQKMFEATKESLTETNVEITPKGIKIIRMDETHTVLTRVMLFADNFNEYECNRDRKVIGLSVTNLCKYQKSITNDDTIGWYLLENDENHLGISVENSVINQSSHKRLKLLELDEENIEISDQQYPFMINMPSLDLQKICRDMKHINSDDDEIDIKQHKNQLIFYTSGDSGDQTTVREPGSNSSSLQLVKTSDTEGYQGVFSLSKMIDFTKCTNLGGAPTIVQIMMKNDYPLMLNYPVADLGYITLCLAPMVEKS